MGNHRMFANTIIDSDKFLDMPLSSQALYFHLGMKADDDGFVASPKKIVRSVNCTEDDLRLLIAKGFVIYFESGIIVITHWHIHNTIRKDRKKDTFFTEEKLLLKLDGNNVYTSKTQSDNLLTTNCQPNDNQMTAQGKVSKDKLSKENNLTLMSTTVDAQPHFDYQSVVELFNSICVSLPKVQKLTDKRCKAIRNAYKLLGTVTFDELFGKVEKSDFLTGRTGKWSGCGFDWILLPSNLTKIIEGNYDNKQTAAKAEIAPRNYDEEF